MTSRHSMEIKALLEQKKMNKSRFNPESHSLLPSPSLHILNPIKRTDSSSTLRRRDGEVRQLEQRLKLLESNYEQLLQETQKKEVLSRQQLQEIARYTEASQRDAKQIQHLNSVLHQPIPSKARTPLKKVHAGKVMEPEGRRKYKFVPSVPIE